MSEIIFISELEKIDFPKVWYEISSESHFWFLWRLGAFKRFLEDCSIGFNQPLKILEIGCGTGILLKQLEETTKWEIDGADLNMVSLMGWSPARGRKFYYNVFDKEKRFEEFYDGMIMFDVLEHISRPREFLKAAAFHLKKGAHLFLNMPANRKLFGNYDRVVGHLRRYSPQQIENELRETPLKLIGTRYWGLLGAFLVLWRNFLLTNRKHPDEITRVGFQPPANVVNSILRFYSRLETSVLPTPPFGSSILAIAQKL